MQVIGLFRSMRMIRRFVPFIIVVLVAAIVLVAGILLDNLYEKNLRADNPENPNPPVSGEIYGTLLYNDPALLAYYRLEDNRDMKGGYPLSVNSAAEAPTFQAGAFGLASDSGTTWGRDSGHYNNALCIATPTTPVTIVARIKLNAYPPNSSTAYDGDFVNVPICSHNVEYTLGAGYFNTSTGSYGKSLVVFGNRAQSGVYNERAMYAVNLQLGVWYGLAFAWDGNGTEQLYFEQPGGNFTLVQTLTGQSTATGSGAYEQGLGINGAWRTGNMMQAGVGGAVDDLGIFTRALTGLDMELLSIDWKR